MKISELIALLEQRKEEYGDEPIVARSLTGDYFHVIHEVDSIWGGNGIGYISSIVVE